MYQKLSAGVGHVALSHDRGVSREEKKLNLVIAAICMLNTSRSSQWVTLERVLLHEQRVSQRFVSCQMLFVGIIMRDEIDGT